MTIRSTRRRYPELTMALDSVRALLEGGLGQSDQDGLVHHEAAAESGTGPLLAIWASREVA